MAGPAEEERIALFFDYENLAIGAKERGGDLDVSVIIEALNERGRVVVRRAYADWNLFSEHRQRLVAERIEMIEVPQRTGMVRKNAADIKLAVDALELSFNRDFVTTFVIASGDSDFTPLVLKLRELNKLVVGVGVEGSTSELLPGACDEFLFYGKLVGSGQPGTPKKDEGNGSRSGDLSDLARRVTRTLTGLQRSIDGQILSSQVKRALLRKDPTFSEGDYGFRTWSEMMRHLETMGMIELRPGTAAGDPAVEFPSDGGSEENAFELLRDVVGELEQRTGSPQLSGLKNELRRRQPGFSEKDYGYGGFLQFVKAARAKGLITMDWDDDSDDYVLSVGAV